MISIENLRRWLPRMLRGALLGALGLSLLIMPPRTAYGVAPVLFTTPTPETSCWLRRSSSTTPFGPNLAGNPEVIIGTMFGELKASGTPFSVGCGSSATG
jgi:hypothetical protein